MIDDVAKALCKAAGSAIHDALPHHRPDRFCQVCDRQQDGTLVCTMWTSFRSEAKAVIIAAHAWHKQHRRWPQFVTQK